jgi:hypothetical protein
MTKTATRNAGARKPAAKTGALAVRRRVEAELISADIAKLAPPLQADYGEVCVIVANLNAQALRAYRQLGCLVHKWQNDRDTYGSTAVELVSKLSHVGTSVLYAAAQMYDRISEDEFDSWVSARTNAGGAFTWTHATHLIRVPNVAQRQDLFERTMREGLTSGELEQQVRALNDGINQRPGSGRKFAKPANELHFRGNFESVAKDMTRRVEQVWLPTLHDFAQREPNLAAIGELDIALRQHDVLTAAVHRQRDELLRVRNLYAQALKQPLLEVSE